MADKSSKKYNDAATKSLWRVLLSWQTSQEKINEIIRLVAAGADVNTVDNYGKTPLMYACAQSCIDEVLVLLEAGASVLPKNKDGQTALDFAKGNDTADREKIIALLEKTPELKQKKAEEEARNKAIEETNMQFNLAMLQSNEHSVQEMLFLVLNELREMKAKENIANNEKGDIKKIIVTTGDLKRDYEILGPVYFEISNQPINLLKESKLATLEKKYKEIVAKNVEEKGLSIKFRTAFYIAVEELKKQAEEMGADAIVAMRQDSDIAANNFQFFLQMYGTAVKYR